MQKPSALFSMFPMLLASLAGGAVLEDFGSYSSGNTLATPLNGGTNWVSAWGADNSLTAVVSDATPLNGGGNHLTYTGTGSSTRSLIRNLDPSAVDLTANHTVRFDWRAENLANFSDANDRFEFWSSDPTIVAANPSGGSWTTGDWTSYLFAVFGANRGNSTGGRFVVYNPAFSGSAFDVNNYYDLGAGGLGDASSGTPLTVVAGTRYEVRVDVRPSELEWDLWISDGVNTAWTEGLHFWGTGPTQSRLVFQTRGNNANDTRSASIDNLTVAIPEPGTLALVGIALGSLLVFRRKS